MTRPPFIPGVVPRSGADPKKTTQTMTSTPFVPSVAPRSGAESKDELDRTRRLP